MNSLVFLGSISLGDGRGAAAAATATHNRDEGERVVWHPALSPEQAEILALRDIAGETSVQGGTAVWVYSGHHLDLRLVRKALGREDAFLVHCPGGELEPVRYAQQLARQLLEG